MTHEERKAYQEYLADFDPTPQCGGEDYDYPMSEDAWLEEQESTLTGRPGALAALDRLCEENYEGLKLLAKS